MRRYLIAAPWYGAFWPTDDWKSIKTTHRAHKRIVNALVNLSKDKRNGNAWAWNQWSDWLNKEK